MPTNFGTTPYSAETLPANTFPVSAVFVPGTASGNLTAMQGGSATTDGNGYTSAPGSVYIADGNDVTQGTSTDTANANSVIGQLKQIKSNTASVTIGSLPAISGTVTANQGGSWTVTANAGTNLNTSALALDTSVNGILLSQGSTTNGEKGPLIQGAVTTGSPSYTTAQTSPFSLTTAGALRVDASATTQPVSGTFWQATQPVSGTVTANAGTGTFTVSGTVTSNIGTTNGLALDTSVNGLLLAQGSTTSGEKGPLIQGAVTTNAPSYTTAQTSPLSLDASGLLRASLKDTPSNTNNFNVNIAASAVTQAVSGTVTANQGGAPWSENITQFGGSNIATGTGASGSGVPRVTVANDSNVLATQSGTWTVQPGNSANTTPWLVQTQVGTAGGSTPYHNVVSSGTNGTNVKSSAGQVYDGSISNTSSSAVYFRFYDTNAAPTVGTTTTKRTIQVPGNGTVLFSWPNGLKFTSGIAWGITAAIADNDTTAISASASIDFGYA